jgi:hypothetical protein
MRLTPTNLEDTVEIFGGQNFESEWKTVNNIKLGDVSLYNILVPLGGSIPDCHNLTQNICHN